MVKEISMNHTPIISTLVACLFLSCGKGLKTSMNSSNNYTQDDCFNDPSNNLKIWVTNEQSNGDLGGISGADDMCANLNDANHPGDCTLKTYKALIVDGVNRVACTSANCTTLQGTDWVLAPNTSYFQADGVTPIFTTNGGGIFVFGTMSNHFMAPGNHTLMWTGLASDWTPMNSGGVEDCADWSSNAGGNAGAVGRNDLLNVQAIQTGGNNCGSTGPVICVQQ